MRVKIEACEFAEDALYDEEGLTWARKVDREIVVGITSILAAVAGKLTSVRGKATGIIYARGEGIGAIESGRYFGIVRTPVTGQLLAVNEAVLRRPRILSESPYTDGWFARLLPSNWRQERRALMSLDAATDALRAQIAALRVRCFAAVPDYEMWEIGVECAAVLVKLNDLLPRIEVGEAVHLVSDDATAPVEMARWSEETGQPVIDARKEGKLFHYLVRKVR